MYTGVCISFDGHTPGLATMTGFIGAGSLLTRISSVMALASWMVRVTPRDLDTKSAWVTRTPTSFTEMLPPTREGVGWL